MTDAFQAIVDAAILSGEGSGAIGKRLGINPTTVRRRRSALRKAGHSIQVRSIEARQEKRDY